MRRNSFSSSWPATFMTSLTLPGPEVETLRTVTLAALQAVEKALKAVDGKVRPVDPREALKGRLDYAQVKDWGSGNSDEADALQARLTASAMGQHSAVSSRSFCGLHTASPCGQWPKSDARSCPALCSDVSVQTVILHIAGDIL